MRGRLNKLICFATLLAIPFVASAQSQTERASVRNELKEQLEKHQNPNGSVLVKNTGEGTGRASASVQYDSGNLTLPTFGFGVRWGNLFDEVQAVPVFSSGTISQVSFYVPANGSAFQYYSTFFSTTLSYFIVSMAGSVVTYPSYSGAAVGYRSFFSDISYASTTQAFSSLNLVPPFQFVGNKILAGVVNFNTFFTYNTGYTQDPYTYCGSVFYGTMAPGGCIGLDSGTNLSQGYKGFTFFVPSSYPSYVVGFPFPSLNAMFRIRGNLAAEDIPVELMDFEIN